MHSETDTLDDVSIACFDAEVELSHALWADEISGGAKWPREDGFKTANAYHARRKRFDENLTSTETRQIGRILFQLKAHQIDTVDAMETLVTRHNESIESDLADHDYILASGINPERLRQAIFSSDSEKEVLLNAVARFGAGVLHKSAYCRFLVRHANVNRVNAAIDTLCDAGFLSIHKGANNANVVLSDGRLEIAHRNYVQRIVEGAAAL